MVGLSHRARQRAREAWEDYRTIDHRTTDTRFSFFAFQFARLPRHPFARNLIVSLSAFQFFRFSAFQPTLSLSISRQAESTSSTEIRFRHSLPSSRHSTRPHP